MRKASSISKVVKRLSFSSEGEEPIPERRKRQHMIE